jgi:acetyl-CoA C-acetyltransferase
VTAPVNPRTPIVVGVGQVAERIDDAGYRGLSAVELAAAAARAALQDTGVDTAAIATLVDTVAGVRQFEISGPMFDAPLGKSTNYPRSVADRISAAPARAILEVVGGQSPQHLINELAATIAKGESECALVLGSEAISTVRHLANAEDKPDFTETVDGQLEDRGYGLDGLVNRYTARHGLVDAPTQYGLLENARRARLGMSPSQYAKEMGELFAPFTRIAARNPYAASPVERSVDELITVTETNRLIAHPYPRLLVSRDQVNQGAAVILMSVGAARRLGVPEPHWVFLRGHADLREQNLMDRVDLSHAPSAPMAVQEALRVAGIGVTDVSTLDLYSCFPVAVFNVCDGIGLAADDPRGLTLTGGLPYFGGAGNNYSMHAVVETVYRMRTQPGHFGLVGANGGTLSKYSVGVYSTAAADWASDRSAELQNEISGLRATPVTVEADGWARIETYTVRYDKSGRTGIIIGRLESDDSRIVATTTDGDSALLELLCDSDPIGSRVWVESFDHGNRAALSPRGTTNVGSHQ